MGSKYLLEVRNELERALNEPALAETLAELAEAFDGLDGRLARLETRRDGTQRALERSRAQRVSAA